MNTTDFTFINKIGLAIAIVLSTSIAISAQQDDQFAAAQQADAKLLRQYAWKSRTEVRKGGETKAVKLDLVRYDLQGSLQRTPLNTPPQQQMPSRLLPRLVAQKKKENFVDLLDGLSALAKSYGELSPDKMQRFMTRATVTPELNSQQRLVRLSGRDVLQPGDSMTIWVDPATRKQQRVEIQTSFEQKPVRIVSEFSDLPGGPRYMARSAIDYSDQELIIITENFDHTRER